MEHFTPSELFNALEGKSRIEADWGAILTSLERPRNNQEING
jgi:hypothetical protein